MIKYVLYKHKNRFCCRFFTWDPLNPADLIFAQSTLTEHEYTLLTARNVLNVYLSENQNYYNIVPYSASYVWADDYYRKRPTSSTGTVLALLRPVGHDLWKGARLNGKV